MHRLAVTGHLFSLNPCELHREFVRIGRAQRAALLHSRRSTAVWVRRQPVFCRVKSFQNAGPSTETICQGAQDVQSCALGSYLFGDIVYRIAKNYGARSGARASPWDEAQAHSLCALLAGRSFAPSEFVSIGRLY